MNQQTNEEPNNQQQPLSEDLTVNEEQAAAVKGGNTVVKSVRFRPGKDLQELS